MFADDPDMTPSDSGSDDAGKTMQLPETPKDPPRSEETSKEPLKPEKKADDWQTVNIPKIAKAEPAPVTPPVAPSPSPAGVEATINESPTGPAAPSYQATPGASSLPPAKQPDFVSTPKPPVQQSIPASSGTTGGGFMSNMSNTQKYAIFGVGGGVVLCCLCSCVTTIAYYAMSGG